MMIKFKGFFDCCHQEDNVTDPNDVDKETKVKPRNNSHRFRTENETLETQGNYLTTSEGVNEILSAKGPRLILAAFEGEIIPLHKEFLINPRGLESGGQRRIDGSVSIGRLKLAKDSHVTINDIVLDDPTVGERHCMIKYNPTIKKYFIKDQGEGSGTFIKIEEGLKLENGSIISFSDSHMIVKLGEQRIREAESVEGNPDESLTFEDNTVYVRFLDGPKATEEFKFKPEEKTVKVGRMNDCQIKFDGNNLSRYQCTIKFISGAWYIYDGMDDRQSTNGTWVFLESYHEVMSGAVIKIGQTIFKARIEGL